MLKNGTNYYPFGLQHNTSWTRPTDLKNRFLYNAGSELDDRTKNYETFHRHYDPAIGRMSGVDPVAVKYASLTPYNYAFNDPVAFNDPMGDDPMGDLYGNVASGSERFLTHVDGGGGSINRFFNPGYGRPDFYYGPSYEEVSWARLVNEILNGGTAILDKFNGTTSVPDQNISVGWTSGDIVGMTFTSEVGSESRGGYFSGLADGAVAGAGGTIDFFKSLGTAEGWENLGKGVVELGNLACSMCPQGIVKRGQMADATGAYIKNIPNMSAYELGYATGYGAEKIVEAVVLTKGIKVVTGAVRAAKGSTGLVVLTEETFSQALFNGAETIGSYSIHGTKGLVGNTFNRNIFLIEASGGKSLSGFRSLVGSLEAEALNAGANRISIYGSSVINKGFLSPRIANRFGYSFQESGSGVFLQKGLR